VTYIETTPDKLWHALTDGDFTERYWFGVRLRSDWKVGSSFEMVHGDGQVSDAGKVVEYDPPKRLAYTFVNIVKLTLTHEGFAPDSKMLPAISKGWPAILSSLKSILETGHPLEIPHAALKLEN